MQKQLRYYIVILVLKVIFLSGRQNGQGRAINVDCTLLAEHHKISNSIYSLVCIKSGCLLGINKWQKLVEMG